MHAILLQSLYISSVELTVLEETAAAPAAQAAPAPRQAEKAQALPQSDAKNEYKAVIKFEDGCEMENIRAFALIHNLEDKAVDITYEPDNLKDDSTLPVIKEKGFQIHFYSDLDYVDILEHLSSTIYLKELDLVQVAEKQPVQPEPEALPEPVAGGNEKPERTPPAETPGSNPQRTGGAVVQEKKETPQPQPQQARSTHTARHQRQRTEAGFIAEFGRGACYQRSNGDTNPELEGLQLDSFNKEARQLHKIINDIQDTVMAMRMVPLSPTFFKMHRIVRDMCRSLGKEVQLEVLGEDTEVDKNIIEHISDPLMHIIRNSVDHGIEMPEDRMLKGKPEKGTIVLEAKNSGGDVLITVKDDGSGINRDKIVEKARRLGLLEKPEEEYTDKEIYQFILLPGFSTSEEVTKYSGRGVGMDVVVNNIEMVGGTVLVDSEPGAAACLL